MKNVFFVAALVCITHTVHTQQVFKTIAHPTIDSNAPSLLDSEQTPQAPHRIYPFLRHSQRELIPVDVLNQQIESLKNQRREMLSKIINTCAKTGISVAALIAISVLLNKLRYIQSWTNSAGKHCLDHGIRIYFGQTIYITPVIQKCINIGVSASTILKLLPAMSDFILYKQLSVRQQKLEQEVTKDQKPTQEQIEMQQRYTQLTQEAAQLEQQLGQLAPAKKRNMFSQCTIV